MLGVVARGAGQPGENKNNKIKKDFKEAVREMKELRTS